ncbi:MAG: hypothetical protein R3E01_11120 [Pirellulaceae bacterium]
MSLMHVRPQIVMGNLLVLARVTCAHAEEKPFEPLFPVDASPADSMVA